MGTATRENMPFAGHRTCAEWGDVKPVIPLRIVSAPAKTATGKIDLRHAPSGMEQAAAEWSRKAAAR